MIIRLTSRRFILTREKRVIIAASQAGKTDGSVAIVIVTRLAFFRFIHVDITSIPSSVSNKSFPRKAAIDHRAQKTRTRELLRPFLLPRCKNIASPSSASICYIARFSHLAKAVQR